MIDFIDQELEDRGIAERNRASCWKVLVADDDPDVHETTALSLQDMQIEGRPLRLLHASSAAETLALLRDEPDVAVILLDVVMESADAGLRTVGRIRDELELRLVRIVLRTGQPGNAPELGAIMRFDINDYKTKTELTRTKLITTLTTAIRSYDQLRRLESGRQGLERIIAASNHMIAQTGLKAFAEGIILQIAGFVGLRPEGVVCATADWRRTTDNNTEYRIVAAAGSYSHYIDRRVEDIDNERVAAALMRCLSTRTTLVHEDGLTLFFPGTQECGFAAYLESNRPPDRLDHDLLEVFCRNIALCGDNVSLVSRLQEVAFSDPLVQIPNRAAFVERLEEQVGTGEIRGLAVALIDIDQFAEINDMLGHQYGDLLLKSLAERLADGLTGSCLVARVAGDGFAVLGEESIVNEAVLRDLLMQPLTVEGAGYPLTVCTGIVKLSECQECDANALLKNAYIALKHAKQLGHGHFAYYSHALAEEIRGRARMLRDLRHAIEARRLTLAYQPIMDLARDEVVGMEALLRWRTDDGTMIPPDEFIPLAEHTGLMVPIGSWVLRTALADAARLIEPGFPGLRVAVNVSAVQFREAGLRDEICTAVRGSGLTPGQVELEVTESIAMTGVDEALTIMQQFRNEGIGLSIDDFGTGYSSLSYLDRLPATRLKIDRSFVQTLSSGQGTRIMELMISLARHLGIKVVAEGVENSTQLEHLSALGCDEVQGYWFARPMPFDELLKWLEARR